MTVFTLITYNLDRKSIYQEERFNAFIEQIKELKPDILVIQEGTRNIYSNLFLIMKRMGYQRSLADKVCNEVIFTKFKILNAEQIRFQYTSQNKGLIVYYLDIYGHQIPVITTQFEEGSRRIPLIRKQIFQISKRFPKGPTILAGDFQIANYQDIKEPDGWIDTWYEAAKSDEKYTINCKINTLAEVQDRPDRVWFLPGDILECVDHRLVGLPKPHQDMIFASKHFGILVKFCINFKSDLLIPK